LPAFLDTWTKVQYHAASVASYGARQTVAAPERGRLEATGMPLHGEMSNVPRRRLGALAIAATAAVSTAVAASRNLTQDSIAAASSAAVVKASRTADAAGADDLRII
jgi:hypothetical protein